VGIAHAMRNKMVRRIPWAEEATPRVRERVTA